MAVFFLNTSMLEIFAMSSNRMIAQIKCATIETSRMRWMCDNRKYIYIFIYFILFYFFLILLFVVFECLVFHFMSHIRIVFRVVVVCMEAHSFRKKTDRRSERARANSACLNLERVSQIVHILFCYFFPHFFFLFFSFYCFEAIYLDTQRMTTILMR